MKGIEESTRSADGTRIGWERHGRGPGLLVLHGGGLAGSHYRRLAAALAGDVTTYLVDRRGRGLSGAPGPDYCLQREIDDIGAVMQATGATAVFGHSGGAAFALEAARVLPIARLAVFDAPVALTARVPLGWVAPLQQALDEKRYARAMMLVMDGLHMAPPHVPRWLLSLGARLLMRGERGAARGALMATVPREIEALRALGDDVARYGSVRCPTLVLVGGKSPPFLHEAATRLTAELPDRRRVDLSSHDHNGPTDMGTPEPFAHHLRAFFAAPDRVSAAGGPLPGASVGGTR